MTTTTHDWGRDGTAWVNRHIKAEKIAGLLRGHGVTADTAVNWTTVRVRNRIARDAGARPPSEDSWRYAVQLLRQGPAAPVTHPTPCPLCTWIGAQP